MAVAGSTVGFVIGSPDTGGTDKCGSKLPKHAPSRLLGWSLAGQKCLQTIAEQD